MIKPDERTRKAMDILKDDPNFKHVIDWLIINWYSTACIMVEPDAEGKRSYLAGRAACMTELIDTLSVDGRHEQEALAIAKRKFNAFR